MHLFWIENKFLVLFVCSSWFDSFFPPKDDKSTEKKDPKEEDTTTEASEKDEKKKEPEATFEILSNPARVMKVSIYYTVWLWCYATSYDYSKDQEIHAACQTFIRFSCLFSDFIYKNYKDVFFLWQMVWKSFCKMPMANKEIGREILKSHPDFY